MLLPPTRLLNACPPPANVTGSLSRPADPQTTPTLAAEGPLWFPLLTLLLEGGSAAAARLELSHLGTAPEREPAGRKGGSYLFVTSIAFQRGVAEPPARK